MMEKIFPAPYNISATSQSLYLYLQNGIKIERKDTNNQANAEFNTSKGV